VYFRLILQVISSIHQMHSLQHGFAVGNIFILLRLRPPKFFDSYSRRLKLFELLPRVSFFINYHSFETGFFSAKFAEMCCIFPNFEVASLQLYTSARNTLMNCSVTGPDLNPRYKGLVYIVRSTSIRNQQSPSAVTVSNKLVNT